MSFTSTE